MKIRGRLRYPGIGRTVSCPNSDRTRLQSADTRRNLLAHVLAVQQLLHRRKQLLTRGGGANPIPLPPEQSKPIFFFQRRDHPADSRRRVTQFSRCPGQAARLHHTHQRPIFFQLHTRSSFAYFIPHPHAPFRFCVFSKSLLFYFRFTQSIQHAYTDVKSSNDRSLPHDTHI